MKHEWETLHTKGDVLGDNVIVEPISPPRDVASVVGGER